MPEELVAFVTQIVTNIEHFLSQVGRNEGGDLPHADRNPVIHRKSSLDKWQAISFQLQTLVAKLCDFFQLIPGETGAPFWSSDIKIEDDPPSTDRSLTEGVSRPSEDRRKAAYDSDEEEGDSGSFSLASARRNINGHLIGTEGNGLEKEKETEADECSPGTNTPDDSAANIGRRPALDDENDAVVEPMLCVYCGEEFGSKRLRRLHFRARHVIAKDEPGRDGNEKLEGWFRCDACESTFQRKSALRDHFGSSHGRKTFLCNLCGVEFKLRRELDEHMSALHRPGEKHVCDVCRKEFTRLQALKQHQSSVHDRRRFSCQFCDKNFSQKIQWRRHVRFVHENDPNCGHTCHHCAECKFATNARPQRFLEKQKLVKHLSKHEGSGVEDERSINCGDCAKKFRSKRELILHAQKVHNPDRKRTIQCNVCAAMFYTEHLCLAHQRRVHEQRRDFQCSFCTKKFQSAQHAKLHERTHTGERPFVCDFQGCGKSFGDGSNLRKHQVIHTGIKPYNCDVCKSGFMRKKQLQEHRCDTVLAIKFL